jgi:integral membrane protein (TIGR00529 family)
MESAWLVEWRNCMSMHWLGLFVAMGFLLLVARKSLPLAFSLSALVLGVFTLSPMSIWTSVWNTVTDPSVLLLAAAMGIIPLIGAIMDESGQMDRLVNNLRIGKRPFLVLSPALLGMLPVPGGALLSSPLVERAGGGVQAETKAVVNVWFRHVLLIIYPLSPALIVSAKIAGFEVYRAIPYLIPGFITMSIIGWVFFLRGVEGEIVYRGAVSVRELLLPLSIILLAPLLDFLLPRVLTFSVPEWGTLIAVAGSLGVALLASGLSWRAMGVVSGHAGPWNFSLMIVGMYLFSNVFRASGMSELMASLAIGEPLLCLVSFALGVITGRIQLPASVVIPTYLSMVGTNPMDPVVFALVFFSAVLGYLVSPVHPCVCVSLEYFKADMGDYLRTMAQPILLALALVLAVATVLL